MAKNRVTEIDARFEAPVPTGAKSGDPVLVFGAIPAVCQTDEGAGVGNVAGRASVDTVGFHSFPCADAVAAEGTKLYVAAGNKALTTTANGAVFGYSIHTPSPVGRAGGTKAAGAGTITVRLAKA